MTAKRMEGNWFNVNNGTSCGIVMPEHVMKKLAKLYTKHNDEVKDLLNYYYFRLITKKLWIMPIS